MTFDKLMADSTSASSSSAEAESSNGKKLVNVAAKPCLLLAFPEFMPFNNLVRAYGTSGERKCCLVDSVEGKQWVRREREAWERRRGEGEERDQKVS